jgi:hypothetical protein
MALEVILQDGHGTSNKAKITPEGVVSVSVNTHPPVDEQIESFPLRQFFKTAAGASAMTVNGGTTPVEFSINASPTVDIWVKTISLRIGDNSGVSLNAFGGISALTNGVTLKYQNDALGEVVIADELKTNLDLIRLGIATGAVGTGTDAYKLDISGGNAEDTYLPVISLSDFPWGIRLKKGSNDKIFFTINDNLTTIVTFNAIGYGSQLEV